MSTELTIPNKLPSFLANRDVDTSLNSKLMSGLGSGGMPLPMLSFRGKVFRLRQGGNEASLRRSELDVIVVSGREGLSKRYYEDAYGGSDEITAPTCWSQDGHTPDAAQPQSESCRTCPLNVWGSATRNGKPSKGKACSDYKRLVVWPLIDGQDASLLQHCVLDIPPASLRAPRGSQYMMFGEYVRALDKHNLTPDVYVATLSFTDAEYPQVCFSPKRLVTEEEYARVQEMQADPDTEEVLTGEETQEEPGPVNTDDAPPTEAAPKKAPPKKASAKPAPKKAEPEPEPEPEEEANATEGDDEGDADVQAVLGNIQALLAGNKG